jgi:hypothetical protein
MKKVLLLMVAVLMVSSVAMADHFGVYSDDTGSSCVIATGFIPTATVIHKFTVGGTGARFAVDLPAGSSFFGFNTPFVPIGVLTSDLSLGYGQCLIGSIPLGTITAIYAPGLIKVRAADAFPNIIYTDCSFGEYPASGGQAWAGTPPQDFSCAEVATQESTWGNVKALYR